MYLDVPKNTCLDVTIRRQDKVLGSGMSGSVQLVASSIPRGVPQNDHLFIGFIGWSKVMPSNMSLYQPSNHASNYWRTQFWTYRCEFHANGPCQMWGEWSEWKLFFFVGRHLHHRMFINLALLSTGIEALWMGHPTLSRPMTKTAWISASWRKCHGYCDKLLIVSQPTGYFNYFVQNPLSKALVHVVTGEKNHADLTNG